MTKVLVSNIAKNKWEIIANSHFSTAYKKYCWYLHQYSKSIADGIGKNTSTTILTPTLLLKTYWLGWQYCRDAAEALCPALCHRHYVRVTGVCHKFINNVISLKSPLRLLTFDCTAHNLPICPCSGQRWHQVQALACTYYMFETRCVYSSAKFLVLCTLKSEVLTVVGKVHKLHSVNVLHRLHVHIYVKFWLFYSAQWAVLKVVWNASDWDKADTEGSVKLVEEFSKRCLWVW